MRITGLATIALLAVTLIVSTARADESSNSSPRNFGTYNCKEQFSCSETTPAQLTQVAAACSARGFGIKGDFDAGSSSSSCLTGKVGDSGGKSSSSTECCVVPLQEGNCSMQCSLLVQ